MRKLAAIVLAVSAAVAPAWASDEEACTKAPKEQWMTADAIKAKLTEQGFKVSKVEIEDGCAEVKADSKDGKHVELYVDPATAAVVREDD